MADTTRMDAPKDELIPRIFLRLAIALVLGILALVTVFRLTDQPLQAVPDLGPVLQERAVVIETERDGATRVLEADGRLIVALAPNEGGFINGMERVIARQRLKQGLPNAGPVVVRLSEGDRLSIFDPATGWSTELSSYGADNLRAFARLLETPQGGS